MSLPADPIAAEHQALRKDAASKRREFAWSAPGRFARVMRDAITEFLKMRTAGVAHEDACKGLEGVIRDVWPARASKHHPCDSCDDTGRRLTSCTHAMRCGRYNCSLAEAEWEHSYVVPCDCTQGDRYRHRPRTEEDELAAVGRRKKPTRGFSRFGS